MFPGLVSPGTIAETSGLAGSCVQVIRRATTRCVCSLAERPQVDEIAVCEGSEHWPRCGNQDFLGVPRHLEISQCQ